MAPESFHGDRITVKKKSGQESAISKQKCPCELHVRLDSTLGCYLFHVLNNIILCLICK